MTEQGSHMRTALLLDVCVVVFMVRTRTGLLDHHGPFLEIGQEVTM